MKKDKRVEIRVSEEEYELLLKLTEHPWFHGNFSVYIRRLIKEDAIRKGFITKL